MEDISFKMFKAKCVGDEIYRICLGHLITLNEDRYFIKSLEYPLPLFFPHLKFYPIFLLEILMKLEVVCPAAM